MNQSLVIAKVSISEKRGNVMRCTQNSAECKTAIKKNPLKERDEKLDFYRGLAILNIVCIHTCFFSGQSYLPDILRTLCLLYDVPILVFLAGRSAQYRSDFAATFWGLIKIWIEWMFISTLVALGYRLLNGKSVGHLFNICKAYSSILWKLNILESSTSPCGTCKCMSSLF